jgi:hypothetical protein
MAARGGGISTEKAEPSGDCNDCECVVTGHDSLLVSPTIPFRFVDDAPILAALGAEKSPGQR